MCKRGIRQSNEMQYNGLTINLISHKPNMSGFVGTKLHRCLFCLLLFCVISRCGSNGAQLICAGICLLQIYRNQCIYSPISAYIRFFCFILKAGKNIWTSDLKCCNLYSRGHMLFNNVYMCVCVCVCVYIYIYIFILDR